MSKKIQNEKKTSGKPQQTTTKTLDSFFFKKKPLPKENLLQEEIKGQEKQLPHLESNQEHLEQQLPNLKLQNQKLFSKSINKKSKFKALQSKSINLPKHSGGRPALTDEQKWKDFCSNVEKEYPNKFKFLERTKVECNKCHTIIQNKKLYIQALERHLQTKNCKESKTTEEIQEIQKQIKQMTKMQLPAMVASFFKEEIQSYEQKKSALENLHNELTSYYRANADGRYANFVLTCLDRLRHLEKIGLEALNFPELHSNPTHMHFEKADITLPISSKPFTTNPSLMMAYRLFHQRKDQLRTRESVTDQTKLVERFLQYCYENGKDVNKSTIVSYLDSKTFKLSDDIPKNYSDSTKKTYMNTLNSLLTCSQPKARFRREPNLRQRLKRKMKKIPMKIQIHIFNTLKKLPDKQLYHAVHLQKYGGVRSTEIIYLQRKNLIEIKCPGVDATYWLIYRQSKTFFDKAVQLPEIVFRFYEKLQADEYLVKYTTARSYRKAYRQALTPKGKNKEHLLKDTIPFFTPHCWRHTGATEILVKCKQMGLSVEQGRMHAQWFLGHIKGKKEDNVAYYDERIINQHPILRILQRTEVKESGIEFLTDDQLQIIRRSGKEKKLEMILPKQKEIKDFPDIQEEVNDLELMSMEVWKSSEINELENESRFSTCLDFKSPAQMILTMSWMPFNIEEEGNQFDKTSKFDQILSIIENRMKGKREKADIVEVKETKEGMEMEDVSQLFSQESKHQIEETKESMEVEEPQQMEKVSQPESQVKKNIQQSQTVRENELPKKEMPLGKLFYESEQNCVLHKNDEEGIYIYDPYAKIQIKQNVKREDGPVILPIPNSNKHWKFTESKETEEERTKWSKYIVNRSANDIRKYGSDEEIFYNANKSCWPVQLENIPCCVCKKVNRKKGDLMLQCRACDNVCHIQCEQNLGNIVYMEEKHYWICSFCSLRTCSGQVESFVGSFDSFPYHRSSQPICTNKEQHVKKNITFQLHPNMQAVCGMDNALADFCLEFCDDLIFSFCDVGANKCNKNKGEIVSLSKRNLATYTAFHELTRKGKFAPMQIKYFKHKKNPNEKEYAFEGWSVQATEDIPKNTLICEYSGNVNQEITFFFLKIFAGISQIFD
jgi:hypothetical protein